MVKVYVVVMEEVPKDGIDLRINMVHPESKPLTVNELNQLRETCECVLSEENGLSYIEVYMVKKN